MPPLTEEEYTSILTTELPSPSDPILQKYLSSRAALINEESKHRSDSSFRQALSPIAKKACDIVARIRHEEHQQQQQQSAITTPTPITETKSWAIIKRLPKGALLRAQCDALALSHIDHLISLALETPGICITSLDGNLATAEARGDITKSVQIRFQENDQKSEQCIWGPEYEKGTFVPLTRAADDYPEGGRPGFIKWLKARCGLITRSDATTTTTQTEKPEKLQRANGGEDSNLLRGLLYYEPIFRKFLRHLLGQFIEDGISWIELRLTFPLNYYRTGSESSDPDSDHLFGAIGQEVASYHRQATTTTTTDPGQRPPWGLRIIWSTNRSRDQRSIIEDADSCIASKLLWPDLVAGYNLAGPENLGRSLTNMLPELFWFRKQCALEEIEIPFFLGAGGGDDAVSEGNLYDALLLGTRRLENARSLYKHPRLIEAVKDKRILVENYLVPSAGGGDILWHPLPALIAQGVPCALVLGDAGEPVGEGVRLGMTHQFWQALHSWESMGLAALGSLAENSVRWAAFEDQSAESW
ncbi:hypothetical protein B0T21DRAFT_101950 [Apiosordaria backusii]|uniref:Uncharacterized protein n=1 Tax=Apiosordaria backusii TaxID=314023 RepID=A0AA40ETR4_9PEZI|nr:hypothetical protein B0T21DRAFT_101950 [Apiosordaria backusii]